MNKTPTTLIIMDGFGLRSESEGNAVTHASTPVLDGLLATCAHTTLSASGLDVGLPDGQMGNSEVGHTNIGGGRVVYQDLPRITRAVEDGSFFENEAYVAAMDACKAGGNTLHLYGLLSDGGVHSHNTHLWALLEMAKRRGLEKVYIHAFLDGRDVSPTSGKDFVAEAVEKCAEIGVGKVATVMGRYYAMDRDKRWDRVEQAYDAMVYGQGRQNRDPVDAVAKSYAKGVTDEFVEPVVCDSEGMISDNDSIIFFNFRPDRAREITRAFVDPDFDGFQREFFPLTYVCTTEYDASMPNVRVAFPRNLVANGLGEYLSKMGMTQLRLLSHRGDGEIRPCHLLLQRRVRGCVPRRGPGAGALPQGGHLRPPAGDERRGGDGQVRGADQLRGVRCHHPQLCQLRHGGPHRRV